MPVANETELVKLVNYVPRISPDPRNKEIIVPNLWETYEQLFVENITTTELTYSETDLQLLFSLGTVSDFENDPLTIRYNVPVVLKNVVKMTNTSTSSISMFVDMKAFYADESLMPLFDTDLV